MEKMYLVTVDDPNDSVTKIDIALRTLSGVKQIEEVTNKYGIYYDRKNILRIIKNIYNNADQLTNDELDDICNQLIDLVKDFVQLEIEDALYNIYTTDYKEICDKRSQKRENHES